MTPVKLTYISCPACRDVSYLTFCSFPFLFDIYYQLILLIDAAAAGRYLQPTLPLALLLPTTHCRYSGGLPPTCHAH